MEPPQREYSFLLTADPAGPLIISWCMNIFAPEGLSFGRKRIIKNEGACLCDQRSKMCRTVAPGRGFCMPTV